VVNSKGSGGEVHLLHGVFEVAVGFGVDMVVGFLTTNDHEWKTAPLVVVIDEITMDR